MRGFVCLSLWQTIKTISWQLQVYQLIKMHQNSFKYYLIENETSIPLISEQLSKVSCCLGKLLSLQMAKRWGNNTPCTWHFPCIPLSSLVRRREEMHWKKKPNVQNCDTANLTSEVKKSIYCYYIIWQFSDKKSQVTQDQNLTKQQMHPLTDSKEGLMLLLLCPTLLGSTLSFWPLTFNRCSNSRYCFCKFSPPLMFSH